MLRCHDLAFAFAGEEPLFSCIDFTLSPGWHGLVGANGAGKSTLLQLLLGAAAPSAGAVHGAGETLLCAQTLEACTPEIAAFATAQDRETYRVRAALRLQAEDLARWGSLSPGEQKRWQIGAALSARPDVLLLDEPSNHLDATARAWLVQALHTFRGIGVVVSHDRTLLDTLTQSTLRLHGRTLQHLPAPYGAARALWEQAAGAAQDARALQQQAIGRTKKQLQALRLQEQATEYSRSTRRRMRSANDSHARSMAMGIRADRAATKATQKAKRMRHVLSERTEALGAFEVDKTLGRSVFMNYQPAPRAHVASLIHQTVRCGAHTVLQDATFHLGRQDRWAIVGDNGAGKSTLVNALVASMPAEHVAIIPQEIGAAAARNAVDDLRQLPPEVRGRICTLLAALGTDPEAMLRTPDPSPGEARKLLIAQALGRHLWAVVLDEPTNHLDLPSIERLQSALAAFPGALLVVTHDETFAQACGLQLRCLVRGGELLF